MRRDNGVSDHGIEPRWVGFDGAERDVPPETLAAIALALGLDDRAAGASPATIDDVAALARPGRCFVPPELGDARVWGLTTQIAGLASERNAGMGDFADLAAFSAVAAREGADFVGVNPVHALFWSDARRSSPFFPSNRRFLNPLYLALDWIDGFAGFTPDEAAEAERLREGPLVDLAAVHRLKDAILHRLFASRADDAGFAAFVEARGDALHGHALFEAISAHMVADGGGATPSEWPEAYRNADHPAVAAFAGTHGDSVRFHQWLQFQADAQLARVQREARAAGMRIGLYLDLAVGAAPDGSAAWADPEITVPGLSVGAPPDPFSTAGQDWGLAPLSPVRLTADQGAPFAEMLRDVMRHAGAVRIDHAMSLARLWLIPRGRSSSEGAYVRYPLDALLDHLSEASVDNGALVIGEDLGNVPPAFREVMARRAIHSYKVFYFERDGAAFADPTGWPQDALACIGTHDLPTFAGWWTEADLALRASLDMVSPEDRERESAERAADRQWLRDHLGAAETAAEISPRVHARLAASPCRLAALQIEDALGVSEQVNLPGTTDAYPNWRRRLHVPIDGLADHPMFAAHAAAMRAERPR